MLVVAIIVGQEQHSRRTRSAPRVLSEPSHTLQADHSMSIPLAFIEPIRALYRPEKGQVLRYYEWLK
jgi:hypothetical protein